MYNEYKENSWPIRKRVEDFDDYLSMLYLIAFLYAYPIMSAALPDPK